MDRSERAELAKAALEEGEAAKRESRPSKHTRRMLTALGQARIAFCATVLGLFYSCFCKSGMNAGWLALMSLAVLAASAALLAFRRPRRVVR